MKVFEKISEVIAAIEKFKCEGKSVGLVPTMGYLHSGHASLVSQSVKDNDVTVVSIFVNPTQFGANEDLSTYPRDIKADTKLLESLKADIVFTPSVLEMYGENNLTKVYVSELSKKLCGITRPIHFEGVTTVVSKLFNIVTPTRAYFGSKDLQQLQVIKRMVKDLNFNVKVISMPIVRSDDGLALSSRNSYLSKSERSSALHLSKALTKAREMIDNGEKNVSVIKGVVKCELIKDDILKIDYVNIVNLDTLEEVDIIENNVGILLAVYVNKTRLIDNLVIDFL